MDNSTNTNRRDLKFFKLRELSPTFREDHLVEHMTDYYKFKQRGYAVALFQYHHCTFAIPLRSTMLIERMPNLSYYAYSKKSVKNDDGTTETAASGLYFQGAIILPDGSDSQYLVPNKNWMIEDEQYENLYNHEPFVQKRFSKFLKRYVEAVQQNQIKVLRTALYRYSTLPSYHKELGLSV